GTGDGSMTLQITETYERLRASHISRWGIVQTTYPQNIAEHMWRVWLLCRDWGAAAGMPQHTVRQACEFALVHDLAEIRTGDAPTPHKTPELKELLAGIEAQIVPEVAELEATMAPEARELWKFCDTAEAVLFLKVNGLGAHAYDVQHLLMEQMKRRLMDSVLDVEVQDELMFQFERTIKKT
nr:Chain A, DatZ [Cyanophage S-2L]6ZPB_A Chain A, DatZ [Cyanophage S-2L]6ZPC_A Chain A, DatZ [Cyanophage S-2L]